MPTLKLPDGSIKQVPPGTRPRDVAEGIGKRLAQAAIAAKVNGTVVDLNTLLPDGSGWTLFDAQAVNSRGQIVGGGIHNGEFHAYLMTPVH